MLCIFISSEVQTLQRTLKFQVQIKFDNTSLKSKHRTFKFKNFKEHWKLTLKFHITKNIKIWHTFYKKYSTIWSSTLQEELRYLLGNLSHQGFNGLDINNALAWGRLLVIKCRETPSINIMNVPAIVRLRCSKSIKTSQSLKSLPMGLKVQCIPIKSCHYKCHSSGYVVQAKALGCL